MSLYGPIYMPEICYYVICFLKGHVLMYSLHVLGMREAAGAQPLLLLDINDGSQFFFFFFIVSIQFCVCWIG